MDFAINKDARKWFRDIRDDLDYDFDSLYFCFIAGLIQGRKRKLESHEVDPLTDQFPKKYEKRRRLIIALFLSRLLEFQGVSMNNKKAIHEAISNIIDPHSPTCLKDEGVAHFNSYAHGGYEVLQEWFDDRPRSLSTFLRIFKMKISEYEL